MGVMLLLLLVRMLPVALSFVSLSLDLVLCRFRGESGPRWLVVLLVEIVVVEGSWRMRRWRWWRWGAQVEPLRLGLLH